MRNVAGRVKVVGRVVVTMTVVVMIRDLRALVPAVPARALRLPRVLPAPVVCVHPSGHRGTLRIAALDATSYPDLVFGAVGHASDQNTTDVNFEPDLNAQRISPTPYLDARPNQDPGFDVTLRQTILSNYATVVC